MKNRVDVDFIYNTLDAMFPEAKCELNFTDNYQLLVAVMLSARCTDRQVNKILPQLFEKYPTAYDLASADIQDVQKLIYSCGFYKNKSKNIILASQDLVNRYGGQVPDSFEELVGLSGVGRKTANVVLAVGYSQDAIAVDTHVFRTSNRLGLVTTKSVIKCEEMLKKVVPKNRWSHFHHLLVLFGRYFCKSQSPKCQECLLKENCKYFKSR